MDSLDSDVDDKEQSDDLHDRLLKIGKMKVQIKDLRFEKIFE